MSIKKKEVENLKNKKKSTKEYTKEEMEYILAENEYLKKMEALIQRENQKSQKK